MSASVMTMSSDDQLRGQLDRAMARPVAVHDDVRGRLVDRLDEVVDAVRRRLAATRHVAHDRAHLGEPVEFGGDRDAPADLDHPVQSAAADQAWSSTMLPSGSVV